MLQYLGAAINGAAWQAIVPELLPRSQLMAAIALNSAEFNIARAVGPAIAGFILVAANAGVVFLIDAQLPSTSGTQTIVAISDLV
ncbi:MAG: MFS transporter [Nostoc sp.]|uniref:MFS transporter n=1 Tax=Nostoc sp. TaxID=1180 RepID=UPI002FF8CF78